MPKITYILPDGLETVLDAEPGTSVMRTAVSNGVPGIVAECGGSAMCATCHVYVETEEPEALPAVSDVEDEMLDCTAPNAAPTAGFPASCKSWRTSPSAFPKPRSELGAGAKGSAGRQNDVG